MNTCLKNLLFSSSLKQIVLSQGKGNLNYFRHGSNIAQLFKSTPLVKPDGTIGKGTDLLKDKVTAIYFSASWCGPCKQFTPLLKEFYDKVNKDKQNMEVIFLSLDRNKSSMEQYFKEYMGTWLRTEYDQELISSLAEECDVSTIPSLKIVKDDGSIVNTNAREDVMIHLDDDCEGLLQKWKNIGA
uniref:protein-disulfide reductase n=1 Tax=Strongyloides stercoralis TaxID=6248 RepID=A0A0K0EJG4_STRER